MRFILVFMSSLIAQSLAGQKGDCDKLTNGIYLIQFDTLLTRYENYKLRIQDSRYTKYFLNGDSASGNLEWGDYCNLYFNPDNKINPDSLSGLEKSLFVTCGYGFFTVEKFIDNRTRFIFWCNWHVMRQSGVLMKQNE